MNKILILGSTGMLGSRLFLDFSKNLKFNTYGTARNKKDINIFKSLKKNIFTNVDCTNIQNLKNLITKLKPDVVINCIGLINKKISKKNIEKTVFINTFLPHFLNKYSYEKEYYFIHISTDCVFKGGKKIYFENSLKDADDIYGLSKNFGEFSSNRNLIIRTSIIGHELKSANGLLEWFLSQEGKVFGYSKAVYSGVTTNELSKIIVKILEKKIVGLFQISSKPITKYDLLNLIKKAYNLRIKILKNSKFEKKIIMNSIKFKKYTGLKIKSWKKQVKEMHNEYKNFK